MKKYLLPKTGNFYKANLHCHTIVSDGKKTPEEVKELYMKKGYSIVAYTDHAILIPHHHELSDENFLALNGVELEVNKKYDPPAWIEACHICYIPLSPDNHNTPAWHRSGKYLWGNTENYFDEVKCDESEPDFERAHTPECLSKMMQMGREKGYFVTYNHPTWSYHNYNDYMNFHGMHAMEIVNGGSFAFGYLDYNPRVYDDMLAGGEKIYCIATDDNHNAKPDDSSYSDSGIAFTMIKAEKLEYETITKALVDGNFYASEGPEIYELYCEDNKVHIKCSEVASIYFSCPVRQNRVVHAEKGATITEASFDIPASFKYFRLTLIDKFGKRAFTNAYFPEDVN